MGNLFMNINITDTLIHEVCCNCGVSFGVPSSFKRERLKDHVDFYCPNGHGQHYTGKSEEEKLRDELRSKENELQQSREYYQGQISAVKTRLKVSRAAKTRLMNRVKNGVCPCCNRSFVNLQRHMETQHPKQL